MNKTNQKPEQKPTPKNREPDGAARYLRTVFPGKRSETNAIKPEQTPGRTAGVSPEQIADQTGLQTPDQIESLTVGWIRSKTKDGSPTTRPCTNIGSSGTADEESSAEIIPVADGGGKTFSLRPVPIFLVAPTLSREIPIYNRVISDVAICRAGENGYMITLTTHSVGGVPDAD